MRITMEVIRSRFGTAVMEEWTVAAALPGCTTKKVVIQVLVQKIYTNNYRWTLNQLQTQSVFGTSFPQMLG